MKNPQKKEILGNTAYTMAGMLLMNGVLQLMVYPLLNRYMGADSLGGMLYIMGLVSIVCPSVGQALNTSRLVVRRDYEVSNGDYNLAVLLFGGIGSLVAVILSRQYLDSAGAILLTIGLLLLTAFRYYGDVEYRLSLHYKRFFIYYLAISIGYIGGFGLYRLTDNWYLIFLCGEGLSLLYVGLTGSIFRQFGRRSPYFRLALGRGFFLMLSYLVTNGTLNIDRVILKPLLGNVAVTQYYVVSLIGKTMVLFIAPINTIVISYLTKREKNVNGREYRKLVGIGALGTLAFFGLAMLASPIFLRLFYPDLYDSVSSLMLVVNLSQVLGMYSAFLFILVLTFTEEKWQLILQILHLGILLAAVLIGTNLGGLAGFSAAVLIANIIRVVIVTAFGAFRLRKQRMQKAETE